MYYFRLCSKMICQTNRTLAKVGIRTLFFLLLLLPSCLGNPTKDEVYILEDGELVDAQGYRYFVPGEGGTFEIDIVSWGIEEFSQLSGSNGLTLELDAAGLKRDVYDTIDLWGEYADGSRVKATPRYLEKVIVTASPNHGIWSRKAKFRVRTRDKNGHIADISVIQKGG